MNDETQTYQKYLLQTQKNSKNQEFSNCNQQHDNTQNNLSSTKKKGTNYHIIDDHKNSKISKYSQQMHNIEK